MNLWTPTDDQILRKWHGQDLCDADIALKMGRHVSTVGNMRRELGLPVNPKRTPSYAQKRIKAREPTLEEIAKIMEWYQTGIAMKSICNRLKCGHEMVSTVVAATCKKRVRGGRDNPHKPLIVELHQAKFGNCTSIAKEVTRQTGTLINKNQVIGVLYRAGLSNGHQPKDCKVGKFFTRASGNSTIVFNRDPYRGEAPTGCRYPHGEGAALVWCNDQRQPGSPYCTHHHIVCHKPREDMLEAAE